ncbi:MAG: DUF2523 family protein [Pseudomonadota bacterium]|nr:DUF2523 family protein [Pseudomonadota bacterium]
MGTPVILWKWLEDVLTWLKDLFVYIPLKIWQSVLDALAGLIEAIPVPAFMENLSSLVGALDPGIAYFVGPLNLGIGISMMLSAYVIRFLIRRLPVVG